MLHKVLYFAAGLVLGALLSQVSPAEAQNVRLMFGSYNNTAKAITVTSTGAVNVQAN